MKSNKGPLKPNVLLWWTALIALVVSGAVYVLLGPGAEYDVHIRQQRLVFPVIGIVVAGVCLIAGTAGRWFYPK